MLEETENDFETTAIFLTKTRANPRDVFKVVFDDTKQQIYNSQKSKIRETTIFEIAQNHGICESELTQKWGVELAFEDENEFRKRVQIGIDFYTKSESFYQSKLTYSSLKPEISLILSPEQIFCEKISFSETVVQITCDSYLKPYLCNKTESCFYSTRNKSNFMKHLKICSDKTKFTYSECEYGNKFDVEAELRDLNIIKGDINFPFCSYDIETFFKSGDFHTISKTEVNGVSDLVSIGYFYSESKKGVFVKKSDDPSDATEIIDRFLKKMFEIQNEIFESLDPSIIEYYQIIQAELKASDTSVPRKAQLYAHKNFLRKMWTLIVIGYNSSSFDLPVILSHLLSCVEPESVKVIKNGSKYFSLRYKHLMFLDCLNYWGHGSLVNFAQSFGVQQGKSLWPYEKFTNINDLRNQVCFPSIIDFKSSLKPVDQTSILNEFEEIKSWMGSKIWDFFGISQCENISDQLKVSPKDYLEVKNEYDEKIKKGEFKNFEDQLVYYNLVDCKILKLALINFNRSMKDCFGVNLFTALSLPGLSELILWSLYDSSWGTVFSLDNNHGFLNRQIRDSLLGGPCLVFDRHVEIEPENTPMIYHPSVYLTPSGERIRKVIAYDFNGIMISSVDDWP